MKVFAVLNVSKNMNTRDFLHFGLPLGKATRRVTDFVARFIWRRAFEFVEHRNLK
jgi:hypothetical protein